MLVQLPEVTGNDIGPPKEFNQEEHQKLCRKLNNRATKCK